MKKPTNQLEREFIARGRRHLKDDRTNVSVVDNCISNKTTDDIRKEYVLGSRKNRKTYILPKNCLWVRRVRNAENKLIEVFTVDTRDAYKREGTTVKLMYYSEKKFYGSGFIEKIYYLSGGLHILSSPKRLYIFHENGRLKLLKTKLKFRTYYSNGELHSAAPVVPGVRGSADGNPFGDMEKMDLGGNLKETVNSGRSGLIESKYANGKVFERWIYLEGICVVFHRYDEKGRLLVRMIAGKTYIEIERDGDGKLERLVCEISAPELMSRVDMSDVRNPAAGKKKSVVIMKYFNKNGKVCVKQKLVNGYLEGRRQFYNIRGKKGSRGYFFGGLLVPAELYEHPENITVDAIIDDPYVARREAYLRLMGYGLFLSRYRHFTTLDRDADCELVSVAWVTGEKPLRLLKVNYPPTKVYNVIRVPDACDSCLEAIGWVYTAPSEDYNILQE